jgi:hypothetical protein
MRFIKKITYSAGYPEARRHAWGVFEERNGEVFWIGYYTSYIEAKDYIMLDRRPNLWFSGQGTNMFQAGMIYGWS